MNYYELLEISENASLEIIKAAYKAQAIKYHPDNGATGNSEKMKEINEAFNVLTNATLREEYDKKLHRQTRGEGDNSNFQEEQSNSQSTNMTKFGFADGEKQEMLKWYETLPVIALCTYFLFPIGVFLLICRVVKLVKNKNIEQYRRRVQATWKYVGVITALLVLDIWNTSQMDTEYSLKAKESVKTADEADEGKTKKISVDEYLKSSVDATKQTIEDAKETVDEAEEVIGEFASIFKDETVSVEKMVAGLYEDYYPTYMTFEYDENLVLNKYVELKIYVDDELIGTMKQGRVEAFGMILSAGTHELKVSSSIFNSDKEEFEVGETRGVGKIENIFITTIGHKFGDATICDLSGTNIKKSGETLEENVLINAIWGACVSEDYIGVGNFENVMAQYDGEEGILENFLNEDAESVHWTADEYILPESNVRYYSYDELNMYDAETLRYARNEIYARHGRMFTSEDLQSYFEMQPWYVGRYSGDEFQEAWLNEYELQNLIVIKEVENTK